MFYTFKSGYYIPEISEQPNNLFSIKSSSSYIVGGFLCILTVIILFSLAATFSSFYLLPHKKVSS